MNATRGRNRKPQYVQGVITLTGVAFKEGDQYVSICRELGTASCGTTAEEALNNLADAIDVHLNGLEETGEISRVLREKHIRVDMPPIPNEPPDEQLVEVRFAPNSLYSIYQRPVPVAAPV